MSRVFPVFPRRTVLAGLAAAPLGLAKATALQTPVSPSIESLLTRYCGVYRIAPDHMLGVEQFIADSGDRLLLFADYQTSKVRSLHRLSDTEYSAGPRLGVNEPVDFTINFQTGKSERIEGLRLRTADGDDILAPKIHSREEDVVFEQDDALLLGNLILPDGKGPHPAIILLHGSGPLTRYSFGPYARFFNSLGLAVLVYDKRGTGKSSGQRFDASTFAAPDTLWEDYYPDRLANDAVAALSYLRSRRDIDRRRIGFWGSSEGGMLSLYAAAKSSNVAFAINSSGFMGPLWETILYQDCAISEASGRSPEEVEKVREFVQFWMQVARTGDGYEAFSQRYQALAENDDRWLLQFCPPFASLKQMRWTWDHILAFDSLSFLSQVQCPALGLFGEGDIITNAAVAAPAMLQGLADAGNDESQAHIIPDARHSLMSISSPGQMGDGVFDTLRGWLHPKIR